MRRAHQILFWTSSSLFLFCVVALVWAVVTGFVFGMVLDPVCLLINGANATWQRSLLAPKSPQVSRHDAALAEIDRLERELRMGKYEKTQAEFDAEIEAALHPFRSRLISQTRRLAERRRSGSGGSTALGGVGEIYAQLAWAVIFGDSRPSPQTREVRKK